MCNDLRASFICVWFSDCHAFKKTSLQCGVECLNVIIDSQYRLLSGRSPACEEANKAIVASNFTYYRLFVVVVVVCKGVDNEGTLFFTVRCNIVPNKINLNFMHLFTS